MSIDRETAPLADGQDGGAGDVSATDGSSGSSEAVAVLTITPEALANVLDIRSQEDDPGSLALRVAITGVAGTEFRYELGFEELDSIGDDHVRHQVDDLVVVVPADSVEQLQGAVLDLPRDAGQGGMVIRNPNRPDPMGSLPPGVADELNGSVTERIEQLLRDHINPGLAAHGGYASLVGVTDDGVVSVLMGGGCQGCSVSAVTLSEGIRRMILEAIPEATDVVDATDHSAGTSPFYT